MKIVLVAAIGENNVIGRGGRLPWHLHSDMQHFKQLTMNRPVVMGRKTFESIGKPLKDRTNIVVTRNLSRAMRGAMLATSIDAAFSVARQDAMKRGVDEIIVIGGHHIFEVTLPKADRLEITHVHLAPEGDVFFPPIDPAVWHKALSREHPAGPKDDAGFEIATYERR